MALKKLLILFAVGALVLAGCLQSDSDKTFVWYVGSDEQCHQLEVNGSSIGVLPSPHFTLESLCLGEVEKRSRFPSLSPSKEEWSPLWQKSITTYYDFAIYNDYHSSTAFHYLIPCKTEFVCKSKIAFGKYLWHEFDEQQDTRCVLNAIPDVLDKVGEWNFSMRTSAHAFLFNASVAFEHGGMYQNETTAPFSPDWDFGNPYFRTKNIYSFFLREDMDSALNFGEKQLSLARDCYD